MVQKTQGPKKNTLVETTFRSYGVEKTIAKAKTNNLLGILSNDVNNVICHATNITEEM